MKRVLLASVGLMALAGSAGAADLGPRYQPIVPKAPFMSPIYNWTGFYIGINGGGAWGRSNWDAIPGEFDVSGGLIGGTVGYNWQTGPWVFGLEGDVDWANINGSTTAGTCVGLPCKTKSNFLATVARPRRLRLRSLPALRHRRSRGRQHQGHLSGLHHGGRHQCRLDGWRRRRIRLRRQLDRQGRIPPRRSRQT